MERLIEAIAHLFSHDIQQLLLSRITLLFRLGIDGDISEDLASVDRSSTVDNVFFSIRMGMRAIISD